MAFVLGRHHCVGPKMRSQPGLEWEAPSQGGTLWRDKRVCRDSITRVVNPVSGLYK